MARAAETDYLQNFRFHATTGPDFTTYTATGLGEAGFNSVTFPELTIEASEYREGTSSWTKKLPGIPSWSDVTLSRGIVRQDTKFFQWTYAAATTGEFRTDLTLFQFARDEDPEKGECIRQVRCYDCLPIRVKLGGDLDATSGDVSLAEMDVAIEWADILIDGKSASGN
jgi:phage tail-like protein